jgi:hypothetical protein
LYKNGEDMRGSSRGGAHAATMFHGKVAQTWLGFMSADGKDIASSIFTGQLTIT